MAAAEAPAARVMCSVLNFMMKETAFSTTWGVCVQSVDMWTGILRTKGLMNDEETHSQMIKWLPGTPVSGQLLVTLETRWKLPVLIRLPARRACERSLEGFYRPRL